MPILTEAERQKLLVEWNDTRTNYPRSQSIHQLFEEQVAQSPNAPALSFRGLTLSYAALAAARAVWVLASGGGKEEALRESLSPTGTTPLAKVVRSRSQTRIFTDIVI